MNYYKIASTCVMCLLYSFNLLAQQTDSKPNIVFIFADDQTFESIGSFNNNEIKTPNLDRLRNQGTTFWHTYNMGSWSPAVCVSSRTMLNTGKSLWTAASYQKKLPQPEEKYMHKDMKAFDIEHAEAEGYWSSYMKEAGYTTYLTGKWHVEVDADSVFDVTRFVKGGMPKQSRQRYARKFLEGHEDEWKPYDEKFGGYWKGGKHWSEVVGENAVNFIDLASQKEDPFFIYLGFNAPHDPRQSPKKFVDMYPTENIKLPASYIPEYPYNEGIASGRELRDERLAPFPRTEYAVKVNRQEYYAIITHMDEQIGKVLDAIEASGKKENTYIIFTADHGLAMGDHGFVGKQNLYDASVRVPLFIAGPGIKKGKTINEKVYLQDVMATALDIAGSDADVDFQSLMPILSGKKKGHEAIYSAYLNAQRMIRTDRYKLMIYPIINKVRLYDMKKDPNEMNDLAHQKKYRKIADKLFMKFKELQKELHDPLDVTENYNAFFSNISEMK
ncbi:sulfatase-like hydrolase/transferase [Flammeovirga sp. SJP92]|uniref:sulfatase-like hydrolase/transferase n=1 Tax=Flammeovirga sp. SJP92 TaxID=1775430 RepID=UPI0007C75227|nr:sulfatase-like hydrolase/transferase [Flammeovirga sp. SJP92]